MGVKLDTMALAELYKNNIREVGRIVQQRLMNPLLFEDWIYKAFGYRAHMDKILEPVHAFTNSIIRQRRDTFHATVQNVDSLSEENI